MLNCTYYLEVYKLDKGLLRLITRINDTLVLKFFQIDSKQVLTAVVRVLFFLFL